MKIYTIQRYYLKMQDQVIFQLLERISFIFFFTSFLQVKFKLLFNDIFNLETCYVLYKGHAGGAEVLY